MEKSSFSLLETILSLIILSILVSGFLQFAYKPSSLALQINSINNIFIKNEPHTNISSHLIGHIESFATFSLASGNTILKKTYKDDSLKLDYFELLHLEIEKNEFKTFK